MLQVLFNGKDYMKELSGEQRPGWMVIGQCSTQEEGDAMIQKDWDYFWSCCDLAPSFGISAVACS